MKQNFKLGGSLVAALVLGTVLGGCGFGTDPDHGLARRSRFHRSALVDPRQPGGGSAPHLRYARHVRREPRTEAGSRHVLEADRRHDLGVQDPRGREIPRRLRAHGRGREVLDRSHSGRDRPHEHDHLHEAGGGDEGRRQVHPAREDQGSGADPAERLHPSLRGVEERRHGSPQRAVQLRQGGHRHRPLQVRLLGAEGRSRSRALRRLLGSRSSPGRRWSARRSRAIRPAWRR